MSTPIAGDPAPDVTFSGPDGAVRLLDAAAQGTLVLAFFQEAGTPACEGELRGFVSEYDLLRELGGQVLAVSVDPPDAQRRFAASLAAPFPILSDPEGAAARAFGVYDDASRRANRAVFVIDEHGTITLAIPWYNAQNSAQLAEVFAALGLEPGAGF